MKNLTISVLLLFLLPSAQPIHEHAEIIFQPRSQGNLFIITIDGFRWQEIFSGADRELINDPAFTEDTATMKSMYWSEDEKERRQRLMPFLWHIVSAKGQLYGNRDLNNKVNTANIYHVSYPGYNEIFTGTTDLLIANNKKARNPNKNVLEYLNEQEDLKDRVVAFTSWDVFPFILNEQRSGLRINSGYNTDPNQRAAGSMLDSVENAVYNKTGTRYDQLTFLHAREYLEKFRPRVLFLGLGETDEYAHQGRYDLYLEQANKIDRMLAELWHWIQTTPGYKDNTTLLITTDHGRGSRDSKWKSHSGFIRGSSETWLALMGPGIIPRGEMKEDQQLYQQQLAGTIAGMMGKQFGSSDLGIVSQ